LRFTHEDAGPPGSSRENVGGKRVRDLDLTGASSKWSQLTLVVSGRARGLDLCIAEALVEAGGKGVLFHLSAHTPPPEPDDSFAEARRRVLSEFAGELRYAQMNVRDNKSLDGVIARIAEKYEQLDGLIAAAGIQKVCPAVDYTVADATEMLATNYTSVFMTATATARQMLRFKTRSSIVLIASMSGLVTNKDLISPVYNSSKATLIRLARNLAMEWGRIRTVAAAGLESMR
ncbi:NAD(P)-binding protein, partial [Cenococcum geophilum 1.58]